MFLRFNHSEITLLSNGTISFTKLSRVLITQKLHYSQTKYIQAVDGLKF